jgi:phosphatidylethanolamine/phosphatidyl-N-methylethanolamine N-methyltransferase
MMAVMSAVLDALQFLGQCATRLRTTGALAPSGRHLARAMVNAIGSIQPGHVIVELGPGTGVFTRELRHRFPGHPVVAIEFNELFAKRLRERMPEVQVIQGCASETVAHLSGLGYARPQVGAVISGLPLLSLPRELSTNIFAAIAGILEPGRRYVQFTYSKRLWRRFQPPGFRFDPTRQVWLNVPPAVVMPFTRIIGAEG